MTRNEFIENVTTWGELVGFCYDANLEECIGDIYSEDAYNDYINETLYDYVRDNGWTDVLEYLQDLPSGYDYYLNVDGDWDGLYYNDNCSGFEYYKDAVLERMDNEDAWDEEDEEPEIINDVDPFDEVPVEQEDISVDDLFATCNDAVQRIEQHEIEQQRADDELADQIFDELCVACGVA